MVQPIFSYKVIQSGPKLIVTFDAQNVYVATLKATKSFGSYCRDIHTYSVLQTIQMKLILLCVWAERAVLGNAKNALKFKYEF